MAEPTQFVWKLNKMIGGIVVLVLLLAVLVIGGILGYHKLEPVLNKEAYNKKCSTSYNGCGKYGSNAECNVLASYNTATSRKVYAERGTADYGKLNGPGNTQWFCSASAAKAAGYQDAYEQ